VEVDQAAAERAVHGNDTQTIIPHR